MVKTGDKVKASINPIAALTYKDAEKECKWYPVCPLRTFYEQGNWINTGLNYIVKGHGFIV